MAGSKAQGDRVIGSTCPKMRAIIAALPGFNADTAVQVNKYEVIGPNLGKTFLALQ